MSSWTRGQVEALIRAISERPYMYDPREFYYKSKAMRTVAMEEIARSLCSVRPDTTANECKRKWHSIRTNYLSEKKKILRSKGNGAGSEMEYVPSLFYFKAMSFIDEHIQVKVNTSTLDDDEEEDSSRVAHHEWEEDHEEDVGAPEAIRLEGPLSPGPSAFRGPGPSFPPPDVLYRAALETPSTPAAGRHRRAVSPSPREGSAALLGAAASAMGTLSGLLSPEDAEGAFGKYVACRLRNVRCERQKAELMFNIEKLFFDHSQK